MGQKFRTESALITNILNHRICILFLLVFSAISYRAVFSHEYVWDDWELFIDKPQLRSPENVIDSITQPVLPGTTYFRPIVLGSFVAEFSLFGVNEKVSHCINLIIHSCNVILVYILAFNLFSRRTKTSFKFVPLLCTLFYASHPSLIEPVSWVAGRFDLFVTFFVLLALVFSLHRKASTRYIFLSLFYFLAALSKEMAAIFPLIWFFFIWMSLPLKPKFYTAFRLIIKKYYPDIALICIVSMLYIGIRSYFHPSIYHTNIEVSTVFSITEHALLVLSTITFYFQMVFIPFAEINPMHPISEFNTTIKALVGVGIVSCMIFAIIALTRWKGEKFLILFTACILSLLPVLNIIPLTIGGNIGHERFLSLPLVFFSLFTTQVFIKIFEYKTTKLFQKFLKLLAILWLVTSQITLHYTIPLWKNNVSLWLWAYEKYPTMVYTQASLLFATARLQQLEIGKKVLEEIEHINPSKKNNKLELAKALMLIKLKDIDKAIETLRNIEEREEFPHELPDIKILLSHKLEKIEHPENWYYRTLFGAYSEALIAIKDFRLAKEKADIGLLYDPSSVPLNLMSGFSLLALDLYEEGIARIDKAKLLIVERSKSEITTLTRDYLEQICSIENKPKSVCERKNLIINRYE